MWFCGEAAPVSVNKTSYNGMVNGIDRQAPLIFNSYKKKIVFFCDSEL